MFSLTIREQILIAAVLLAVASGAVIHHLRTRSTDVVASLVKPQKTAGLADDSAAP
ncbi:MAG: hypothetical protein ABIT76_06805 [Chthoniobacterales bacterium]